MGQGLDVLPVQVGGGLIQSQDATVQTEGLSQSQTDDQGGQHLDTPTWTGLTRARARAGAGAGAGAGRMIREAST